MFVLLVILMLVQLKTFLYYLWVKAKTKRFGINASDTNWCENAVKRGFYWR